MAVQMLKQRFITALILLSLFLTALFFLPAAGWSILVIAMVMQGTAEWSRLAKFTTQQGRIYWGLTLATMGLIIGLDAKCTIAQQAGYHLPIYGVSALLWLIVVPCWFKLGWQVRKKVPMGLAGWAVIIPTGLALLDLRAMSPWLLLGIMALVWVADSAAYFTGRKFGKHKLAPGISPGKTWEGVIGALLGVSIYVVLAWNLNQNIKAFMMLPNIILLACFWVGLAVIGDLFESAIKRQAGVKDSGALLPGHGGLLDRIDALTSTLPLAALLLLLQRVV
jgi:phosphatidate cytidylyltransferase